MTSSKHITQLKQQILNWEMQLEFEKARLKKQFRNGSHQGRLLPRINDEEIRKIERNIESLRLQIARAKSRQSN